VGKNSPTLCVFVSYSIRIVYHSTQIQQICNGYHSTGKCSVKVIILVHKIRHVVSYNMADVVGEDAAFVCIDIDVLLQICIKIIILPSRAAYGLGYGVVNFSYIG